MTEPQRSVRPFVAIAATCAIVSFDDVCRSIACPWLSPYHCPSGIILDVKSRLIRKSTWPHCSGVQLRCSRAQCNCALTYSGDKRTQTTGRRANSPHSCNLRDTVWRDMGSRKLRRQL
ncbi:hypothetical protein AVEN_182210-1 [Araneus ventricosus]|uniref:Uncharacterized protein n=1 Tax=Araneus ventricosus TaxID=182803 RepID=A0A4Y2MZX1_ARAVE|nr:hypothetical protein AVEN_228405-1 [Araneus ventricosus]GBN32534.1 hypothetical protein AVEN_51057-1 [Araneus ventricosus]GBN32586.1 hypothetical protein AVEN_136558-1 [Araneus ventricosus]GBN32615.1 hypothetical protein AVEN_182210-1 [Araneus ventricosus]